MRLIEDVNAIKISWEDSTGQIEYFAPGKQEIWYYETEEYQVEFYTRDNTWVRAP